MPTALTAAIPMMWSRPLVRPEMVAEVVSPSLPGSFCGQTTVCVDSPGSSGENRVLIVGDLSTVVLWGVPFDAYLLVAEGGSQFGDGRWYVEGVGCLVGCNARAVGVLRPNLEGVDLRRVGVKQAGYGVAGGVVFARLAVGDGCPVRPPVGVSSVPAVFVAGDLAAAVGGRRGPVQRNRCLGVGVGVGNGREVCGSVGYRTGCGCGSDGCDEQEGEDSCKQPFGGWLAGWWLQARDDLFPGAVRFHGLRPPWLA